MRPPTFPRGRLDEDLFTVSLKRPTVNKAHVF